MLRNLERVVKILESMLYFILQISNSEFEQLYTTLLRVTGKVGRY